MANTTPPTVTLPLTPELSDAGHRGGCGPTPTWANGGGGIMRTAYNAEAGWTRVPAEGETLPGRFRVAVDRGVKARWRTDSGQGSPFEDEHPYTGETHSSYMTGGALEISAPKGATLRVILG